MLASTQSPLYFHTNPDVISAIFKSSNTRDPQILDIGDSVFKGKGLVFLNGEKWKEHRHLLSPVFQSTNLKNLWWILVDAAVSLSNRFESLIEKSGNITMDIYPEFKHLTFDTIGLAAFGMNFNTINGTKSEITLAIDGLFSLLEKRVPFSQFPYWKVIPESEEVKKWRSDLMSKAKEVVLHKQTKQKTDLNAKPDLLDMMLENKINLSVEDIIQESMTFMIAGTETTATTLAFFFACISMHLDIQDRIFQEIQEKIGFSEPTFENVKTLTFTEMCIKETLRIYPVVSSILGRYLEKDTSVNNMTFKKNTNHLFISILLYHNPKYFPNPMKFDPDRWQTESVKNLPQHVYTPFGGGLRVCIGKSMAMNEMLITIAILLQKFRFTAVNPEWPISTYISFTLQPSKPIKVSIERR